MGIRCFKTFIAISALISNIAFSQTLVISIDSDLGEHDTGYRVYKFVDGEKILIYEGQERQITLPHTESSVYGVVTYNEHAESEIVPRIATYTPPKPSSVTWTMEVTITPPEVNNGQ